MNKNLEIVKCCRCKGTGLDPETNEVCSKCSGLKELDWIQNITGINISRQQKAVLFVIKTLNQLVELDIMSGGNLEIDERAEALLKGFEPTSAELELATLALKREGYIG